MSHVSLSLDKAPPISVPVRFFLTAPLFGIAAAISLMIAGPAALSSRWTPELLGTTHLLTLGYITMVMIGALMQLLPVLAATPVPRAKQLSATLHILLTLGAAALGLGLALQNHLSIQVALFALAPGLLAFFVIISWRLRHSPSKHAAIRGMRLALVGLLVTTGLGVLLAAGHAWPQFYLMRHYTDLHLAWALLGWVGMLTISLAYQVVPMFQMTGEYPALQQGWLTPLLLLLLVLWSWSQLGLPGHGPVREISGYLLAGGFISFGISTLYLQITRRRRVPDITLLFWRLGMGSLLLCILLWTSAPFTGLAEHLPQYPLLLGTLMLLGFVISVINGMLYKILPFLIWLHLQKSAPTREARRQIPNVKKIIADKHSTRQLLLHLLALVLFLAAIEWPVPILFHAALSCFALSCLMLWLNLLSGLQVYRRCLAEMADMNTTGTPVI